MVRSRDDGCVRRRASWRRRRRVECERGRQQQQRRQPRVDAEHLLVLGAAFLSPFCVLDVCLCACAVTRQNLHSDVLWCVCVVALDVHQRLVTSECGVCVMLAFDLPKFGRTGSSTEPQPTAHAPYGARHGGRGAAAPRGVHDVGTHARFAPRGGLPRRRGRQSHGRRRAADRRLLPRIHRRASSPR